MNLRTILQPPRSGSDRSLRGGRRARVGRGLLLLAATLLAIEVAEFGVVLRTWLVFLYSESSPFPDGAIICLVSCFALSAAIVGCDLAMRTIAVRRLWPTTATYYGVAVLIAAAQVLLVMFGEVDLGGPWLAEFLSVKQLTFAMGAIASTLLVIGGLLASARAPRCL